MWIIVLAGSMALFAATAAPPASPPPSAPSSTGHAAASNPGIVAEHLYNGVKHPVMINVTSPRAFGTVSLALMDADGKPLAPPAEVHPGRVDLAEALPAIWSIRKTAFVQLIDLQQPVGSALVVQPMLSRMVPVTKIERRPPPSSAEYPHIVKWVDENQPAPPPPLPPTAPTSQPSTSSPSNTSNDNGAASPPSESKPAEVKPIERLLSGLRLYPETDVIMHTSKGDIRIALRPDQAPNTAWNFLELSRGGFFRDISFHRIVPLTAAGQPFVIQAGDPTGTGDGGPGYWLPMEDSRLPHDFGVISMARSDDPDSAGSQIFFCLSREGTARLDGQYCSFGYAVDGATTIKAISEVELADVAAGRPVNPPMITSAELVEAPPRMINKGRPDERVVPEIKPTQTRPTRVPR